MLIRFAFVAVVFVAAIAAPAAHAQPIEPVSYRNVTIDGPFWTPRLDAVRTGTLEANRHQCDITGRLTNFDRAAKGSGEFQGLLFNDSDVYKVMEGWSYIIANEPDAEARAELDKQLDAWIARIAAAQRPDGYINTYYTLKAGLDNRFTREEDDHETYCMGHLIEAGVAHFEATGKRTLLDVAIKAANYLDGLYGPDKFTAPPGHEELELALVRLTKATGQDKYTKLAAFLIDQRGKPHRKLDGTMYSPWSENIQDHKPAREQTEVTGHAVRAGYLYSAMADLARLGHPEYAPALDALWDDVTQRRIFVTGGIGPSGHNEGFTTPYDIPTASAYQETCASIAVCLWAHRMFLLHGDAKYMDQFETTLYNAALAGVSLDGSKFFYVNPLASRNGSLRQDWFPCACCPPNILRFISHIGEYTYAVRGNTVYANLYAQGTAAVTVAGGTLKIRQKTDYPADGEVEFELTPEETKGSVIFAMRLPQWARRDWSLTINGERVKASPNASGYLEIPVTSPTRVRLDMPMSVERIHADPRVAAARGRIAVTAGPLVYCFEALETDGGLTGVYIPPGERFVPARDADNKVRLGAGGELIYQAAAKRTTGPDRGILYRAERETRPVTVVATPYYAWANRSRSAMAVWMPESEQFTEPAPAPGIKASASHTGNGDGTSAMFDRIEPESSGDQNIPRFTFWSHKGTQEWVQYDFDTPRRVSSVDVYWFDDTSVGECRVPASWTVEYRDGAEWKAVTGAKGMEIAKDRFNTATFEFVTTQSLRVRIKLQDKRSGGVLEWRVGESQTSPK
ncbi:MAG: glycoside hydrolase family 127 protein [Phycisphaerales bacterium]